MSNKTRKIVTIILAVVCLALAVYLLAIGEFTLPLKPNNPDDESGTPASLQQDGEYYSKEDVALYLHTYGELPRNYITKSEAKELGWVASEGNLWEVADGCCIGGDVFTNREGNLPEANGRVWYECDVEYAGGYRGEYRLLYSSDGLIYYTSDHYASFTQLY